MKKKKTRDTPDSIYFNLNNPAGYGGKTKFDKLYKDGENWLRGQPVYTLHKPIRKKFPTRKYMTSRCNELWQMDLMEMIPYASKNKGYRYILTCIDVFSRFARAIPVKRKEGKLMAEAIAKQFKKGSKPRYIQTDLGKEFYNGHVKGLLEKHNIQHYSVNSQFKAALVERFNRTLREKLNRYFTHKGHKVWYNILDIIINTYNNTEHRGIHNYKPSEIDGNNEYNIWSLTNQNKRSTISKTLFKLLDYVRISRIANIPFIKNFDQNWTEECFQIVGIDTKSAPVMYIIEDIDHNIIKGKFYKEELQVVLPQNVFRIEKVLATRGKGKYKQHKVKWYGYSNNHNSWVSAQNFVR
jgi:hypothetical protein